MEVTTRQATAADKPKIFELLQAVSYADKYLFEYFDWMIRDPSQMYLSFVDGRLVGCYQIAMLSDNEAMIGAGRVHPDFQNAGHVSALFPGVLLGVQQRGADTLRALIFPDNARSQKVAMRNGFEKVADWLVHYGNLPTSAASQFSGPADASDLPAISALLDTDELVASSFAVWLRALKESDLTTDRLFVAKAHGEITGVMLHQIIDDVLLIQRLVGQPQAADDLLNYAVSYATQHGCNRWQISVPQSNAPLFPKSLEFFRYDVFRL